MSSAAGTPAPATTRVPARSGAARAKAKSAAVVRKAGAPGHILETRVPRVPYRTDLVDPVLSFVVYGIPAGQGSKRPVMRGGKPILVEQSDFVAPWRDAVREMSKQALRAWAKEHGRPWEALTEPVMISAVVTVAATAAATARGDVYATGTPDLDKMQRAIGDALAPTPLKPSDGAGFGDAAKRRLRDAMMADRRRLCVLHDDSLVVAWDHCLKVYPSTTVDSLGFSGATIQVWRMNEIIAATRSPRRIDDAGVAWMSAADLSAWSRPLTGETWDTAAARLWADPHRILTAPAGPVPLRGRGVSDDALRIILRALATVGPHALLPVHDEPYDWQVSA